MPISLKASREKGLDLLCAAAQRVGCCTVHIKVSVPDAFLKVGTANWLLANPPPPCTVLQYSVNKNEGAPVAAAFPAVPKALGCASLV